MTTSNGAVDAIQVDAFLRQCIAITKSSDTRALLKKTSSGHPGEKLVKIQNQVWDDLGVSKEEGRAAIRNIQSNYPKDAKVLCSLREEFGRAVDVAYLQCLEDRRPSTLRKAGKMPKEAILDFFEVCRLKMETPEVQERLASSIRETGAMPDKIVDELHDEVVELLGFDKEYAESCFKEFGDRNEFGKDKVVAIGYARWRETTSKVCAKLLYNFRKEGGQLNVDDDVKRKLLDVQAEEELAEMSFDARNGLLEKNAKKVNIVRKLPPEALQRYWEKLTEDEQLELAKSELLMISILQHQPSNGRYE